MHLKWVPFFSSYSVGLSLTTTELGSIVWKCEDDHGLWIKKDVGETETDSFTDLFKD